MINELIKLKVVAYIKKVDGDDLLEIILNLNSNKKKYIRITNMYSRKRQRTWSIWELIKNSRKKETYILKTNYGYRDSHYCIKKHISGFTVLKVEY